jgi:hypothetical protein
MSEQLRAEQPQRRGRETRAQQGTRAEQRSLVQALAERVREFQTARRRGNSRVVSTGYAALDRALAESCESRRDSPTWGGFRHGTLVEWLAGGEGGGATTLALASAREACGASGTLVVIDRRRTFYPLAAMASGVDLSRVILVRPANDRDETWAIDQSLRSGGAAAVLAWPEKLDDHLFRRLQLAAEAGGSLGLFVRPAAARQEPSWAEVRLLVEPMASFARGSFKTVSGEGDSPILPRGLGKIGTVPDGFETSSSVATSDGAAPRRVQVEILRSPGRVAAQGARLVLSLDGEAERGIKPQRTQRTQREVRRTA